jgi:hypothetical protein
MRDKFADRGFGTVGGMAAQKSPVILLTYSRRTPELDRKNWRETGGQATLHAHLIYG